MLCLPTGALRLPLIDFWYPRLPYISPSKTIWALHPNWVYIFDGARYIDPFYKTTISDFLFKILPSISLSKKGPSLKRKKMPHFAPKGNIFVSLNREKKVWEKSTECHNHKPQPFPDPKRKTKPTNLNKHKPSKRTKSTKISSLFPEPGNRNTKRTEKHKNKKTHGKTYNKSPCRINHKATKSKTNTGTTA